MSEHVVDLCAAFALGALEPDEAAAVIEHCGRCGPCAAELAQMRGVTNVLPLSCAPESPSWALKRRIVEAARDEIAAREIVRRGPREAGDDRRRLRAGVGRVVWLSAASAIAAAIVVGAFARIDHDRMAQQLAVANSVAASQRDRLAEMGGKAAHLGAVVADITGGRIWDKSGGTGAHWWHCTVVQPPKARRAMLLADMPAAPKGMTFQAWVIRGGTAHDAGVVPAGTSSMMAMPMPLRAGDVVAFTVEPLGGSASPTMPYVMTQTLTD